MKLLFLGPTSLHMKRWCSFFSNRNEVLYATIPDLILPKRRAHLFDGTPVRYLTKEGIYYPDSFTGRVRIAARIVDGTKNIVSAHALQASCLKTVPDTASSPLRLLFQFAYLDRVRRLVSEENPDLVEGHYLFPYGVLAAFSRHRRIVACTWGSDVLVDCVHYSYYRMLAMRVFEKAVFIHGPSTALKRRALKLGCPEEKFFVVPWGADLELFKPQNRGKEIRTEYGIPGDAPVIISCRPLEPLYRINEIIEGFALVKKKLPEARLMILDDGTEKAKLLSLCKDLCISDSVHFTGTIPHEQLPFFLTASDVYAQMPISDGLPVSLQEAMACGLPVITSSVGGNREAVCGNGFFANDHLELAEKVLLILNKNLDKDLGKISRQIAEKRYNRKENMAKMEMLYRRFIL
jgi:glycosyltransferase involved in cell wall biosynthesis